MRIEHSKLLNMKLNYWLREIFICLLSLASDMNKLILSIKIDGWSIICFFFGLLNQRDFIFHVKINNQRISKQIFAFSYFIQLIYFQKHVKKFFLMKIGFKNFKLHDQSICSCVSCHNITCVYRISYYENPFG